MFPDPANLQGLIRYRYLRLHSRHLLFNVTEQSAGRQFLKSLLPRVTPASLGSDPPGVAGAIALTASGVAAMGMRSELIDRLSALFVEGPRAHSMGDFGSDAEEHWWNERFSTRSIHLCVHLWGNDVGQIDAATGEIVGAAEGPSVVELQVKEGEHGIAGAHLANRRLHFGYRDGLTEPHIAWDETIAPDGIDFRRVVLGYPTDGSASTDAATEVRDFLRDGTYSFFRWIYQDVAMFNRWLNEAAAALPAPLTGPTGVEWLAAKLMGRWRDGTPVTLSPDSSQPGLANTDFDYVDDPNGLRCPVSAHIRIVNPRKQPLNPAEHIPVVLRRGMPYGPGLEGEIDDNTDRGLIGMFFTASFSDCYRMLCWMNKNMFSPVFSPDFNTQDFFGSRSIPGGVSDQFTIPTPTGKVVLKLPRLLRTRGTAFFVLPGIAGLKKLAEGQFS